MTIRIQNLTGLLYGWFIGFLYMIPDMIDTLVNVKESWIMVIFYLGSFALFIMVVIERYKAIHKLDKPALFQLLYKHEIIFAMMITITSLMDHISFLSLFMIIYHLYWVYKNYFIFCVKES